MPAVLGEGLNHAFPLRQELQLNTWKKKERQVLIDTQLTVQSQNNNKALKDHRKTGIVIAYQTALINPVLLSRQAPSRPSGALWD
jgi:hypothetical protein